MDDLEYFNDSIRRSIVKGIAEEIVSVQPMTASGSIVFDVTYDEDTLVPERPHGSGVICGCFGRCFTCDPLTDEEKGR